MKRWTLKKKSSLFLQRLLFLFVRLLQTSRHINNHLALQLNEIKCDAENDIDHQQQYPFIPVR